MKLKKKTSVRLKIVMVRDVLTSERAANSSVIFGNIANLIRRLVFRRCHICQPSEFYDERALISRMLDLRVRHFACLQVSSMVVARFQARTSHLFWHRRPSRADPQTQRQITLSACFCGHHLLLFQGQAKIKPRVAAQRYHSVMVELR